MSADNYHSPPFAQSAELPQVSFAVACFNAQPFLEPAIRSALSQRGVSLEVLIVDDGSTDGSLAQAEEMARADPRIRVLRTPRNSGPGGARNLALDAMRGEWFAILDSDDLVDPDRSATLIAAADAAGADMVADNLQVFGDQINDHLLYDFAADAWGFRLGLEEYFRRSAIFGGTPSPGFLKPMIRRRKLVETGIRYNEELRIGEDDEFAVRLLHAGACYHVLPGAMYHYRKHDNSISHRLSARNAERMMEAEHGIRALIGEKLAASPDYRARWKALERTVAFTRSIDQLKQFRFMDAAATLARRPGAIPLYRMPLEAWLRRAQGNA